MKTFQKIALIVTGFLVISGSLIRYAVKQPYVLEKIADLGISYSKDMFLGTVEYDAISGDLFNSIKIEKLQIKNGADSIFSVDRLSLSYSIWDFVSGEYALDRIELDDPKLFLVENQDSVLNVISLIPPNESDQDSSESGTTPDFRIGLLQIINGKVDYQGLATAATISDFNLGLSFAIEESATSFNLSQLEFSVKAPLLPNQLNIAGNVSGDGKSIRMDSLSVSDGLSMLKIAGEYALGDSSGTTSLSSSQLALNSLPDSLVQLPMNTVLGLQLSGEWNTDEVKIEVNAESEFFKQVRVNLAYNIGNQSLTSFGLSGKEWNLRDYLNDAQFPEITALEIVGNGELSSDLESSWWKTQFAISDVNIAYVEGTIGNTTGIVDYKEGNLSVEMSSEINSSRFDFSSSVDNVFAVTDSIRWSVVGNAQNLSPAIFSSFFSDSDRLNFKIVADGVGIAVQNMLANVMIDANDVIFDGQHIKKAKMSASINRLRYDFDSSIKIKDSELQANGYFINTSIPEYAFSVLTEDFNLAEVAGYEEFPTQLNGTGQIVGTGISREQLGVSARVNLSKSLLNGELIDDFSTYLLLENEILNVYEGNLSSTLANAKFEGRRNLIDRFDPENYLSLEVLINDLRSLAPLFGAEQFQLQGTISGKVWEEEDGLKANLSTDLENIIFDDFRLAKIVGKVDGKALPEPQLNANLVLTDLRQGSYSLNKIELDVDGVSPDSLFEGSFQTKFFANNNVIISMGGDVSRKLWGKIFTLKNASVQGTRRPLHLQQNSTISVTNEGEVSVSKLEMRHDRNMHLTIDSVFYSPNRMLLDLKSQRLSLPILQTLVASDSLLRGWANVNAHIDIAENRETFEVAAFVEDFAFGSFAVDSVSAFSNLADQNLSFSYSLHHNAQRLSYGNLSTPYSINGEIPDGNEEGVFVVDIPDIQIIRPTLNLTELGDIKGAFKSQINLSGSSKSPNISGYGLLRQPEFGTIALDSIRVNVDYNDQKKQMELNGFADLASIRLGEITGFVPFLLRPEEMTLDLPTESDSLYLNVISNNFNLGFFQPFVFQNGVDKLSGNFFANLEISGTLGSPKIVGPLNIKSLELDYIPYRLKLRNGDVELNFQEDIISISKATIESGRGTINSSGSIEVEDLIPTKFNIDLKARQFTLSDTKELRVIAGANLKMLGTLERPMLNGDVTLREAEIWMPEVGVKSVENVTLEENELSDFSFYDSLEVSVKMVIPETLSGSAQKVRIRKKSAPEVNLLMGGTLQFEKEAHEDLQLFGPVRTTSGYVRELGKKFQLLKGEVSFVGPLADPLLNIETLYELPRDNIKIYFRIGGTVNNPEFTYESEPPMETQDIVAYVLFGRPFAALAGWQSTVANANTDENGDLKNQATALLLDKAGEMAADRLGLDLVEIDDRNNMTGSGMTIKAGKYLNEKILVAVIQQLGSNSTTQFTLEYQLKKNLQFIFTQSEDNRTGVDVLWKYEY